MTTIVYRDGILAADGRGYSGNKVPVGDKCKIARMTDGSLVGASSTIVGAGEALRIWVAGGCDPEAIKLPDKFSLIRIKPNGEAWLADDNVYFSGPLRAPYFAIGSGAEYALGALVMGANAIEAVNVACKLDVWSDLPIYAASHSGEIPEMRTVFVSQSSLIWLG